MHGFSSIYSFSCRSQCGCVSDFYFWRIRAKEAVIMTMFFWTKSGTEDSSTCILAWQIPGWPATEVLSFACNWCFSRHGDVAFSLFDQQYLSLKFLNWGPLVLWVWNTIRSETIRYWYQTSLKDMEVNIDTEASWWNYLHKSKLSCLI